MSEHPWRVCAWVFLGSLLVQAAWVLTLSPFRGSDEFDHVYRAASVAQGYWGTSGEVSEHGRGELVHVPPSIVDAARPMCESLPYTKRDNCNAVKSYPDGTVTVASGAARYNPVFYWLIGKPAQPFDGVTAMYVMRVMGALLCSIFLTACAWVLSRWATTIWPTASLVLVLTPVTIYSTAVAAPNGLEACAAAGTAVTLLALPRVRESDLRTVLILGGVFASTLAMLRGLGPLFLFCIAVSALQVAGARPLIRSLKAAPRTAIAVTAAVFGATVAGSAWIVLAGSLGPEVVHAKGNPVVDTLTSLPLWFFQSIAAFPLRNEPADPIVYAAGLTVLGGFLWLAARRGTRRGRANLLVTFLIAVIVPVAVQSATFETTGNIWQGRYGWPISLVVLVVAGMNLQDWTGRSRWDRPLLVTGAVCWMLAHTWSTVALVIKEQRGGVFAGDSRWLTMPPAVVGLLTVAGCLSWFAAVRGSGRAHDTSEPEPDRETRSLVSL